MPTTWGNETFAWSIFIPFPLQGWNLVTQMVLLLLLLLWWCWMLLILLDCHLKAIVFWTAGSLLQLTVVILLLQRQSPRISASLSRSVRITTARKHGLLYHMPPQLLSACVCRMSWYPLHRLWASVYCTIPQCLCVCVCVFTEVHRVNTHKSPLFKTYYIYYIKYYIVGYQVWT